MEALVNPSKENENDTFCRTKVERNPEHQIVNAEQLKLF